MRTGNNVWWWGGWYSCLPYPVLLPTVQLQQTINVKWEEKSFEVYSLKKCAGEEKKTCSNSQWRRRVHMHMCNLMESSHRDRAVLEVTKETTLTRSHRQDGDENTGGRASLRRV